jgi:hypothetical protein
VEDGAAAGKVPELVEFLADRLSGLANFLR